DDYNAQIFRSFFQRGEDIGDISVLTSLAVDVGMDAESLRQALATHEFLSSVMQDERDTETLRLTGVPAFIADRRIGLTGVQPVENLRQLVSRARDARQ